MFAIAEWIATEFGKLSDYDQLTHSLWKLQRAPCTVLTGNRLSIVWNFSFNVAYNRGEVAIHNIANALPAIRSMT